MRPSSHHLQSLQQPRLGLLAPLGKQSPISPTQSTSSIPNSTYPPSHNPLGNGLLQSHSAYGQPSQESPYYTTHPTSYTTATSSNPYPSSGKPRAFLCLFGCFHFFCLSMYNDIAVAHCMSEISCHVLYFDISTCYMLRCPTISEPSQLIHKLRPRTTRPHGNHRSNAEAFLPTDLPYSSIQLSRICSFAAA